MVKSSFIQSSLQLYACSGQQPSCCESLLLHADADVGLLANSSSVTPSFNSIQVHHLRIQPLAEGEGDALQVCETGNVLLRNLLCSQQPPNKTVTATRASALIYKNTAFTVEKSQLFFAGEHLRYQALRNAAPRDLFPLC